jgi:hypothetical protein
MRYLTRGWLNGELSDAEWKRADEAYAARVEEIASRLPPAMLRLGRDISLHDAVIEKIVWNPMTRRLQMSFVYYNQLQQGHLLVQLIYDGAMLGNARIDSLRRAAESRLTELVYNEIDASDDGHLIHRLLFEPCEEVTIDFEQFDMTLTPRPDGRVELLVPFCEKVQDDEE